MHSNKYLHQAIYIHAQKKSHCEHTLRIGQNVAKIFGIRKLESLGYRVVLFA